MPNSNLPRKIDHSSTELSKTVIELLDTNKKLEKLVLKKDKISKALKDSKLKMKQSLEKEKILGELKSKFITTASHEFRTPLSNILSSAELCHLLLEKKENSKIKDHLSNIASSVQNLTTMLDEFLTISHLEKEKPKVHLEIISIKSILHEAIIKISPNLKNGQSIDISAISNNAKINSDNQILLDVLIKILSNSSKYSFENSNIICTFKVDSESLRLSISDNGIGIQEKDIPHIFRKFYRAENVINTSGTGLGLNIVKSYMDLLNGTIEIDSQANKGTTVHLDFPAN